jgi:hypothetical protein
VARGNDAEAAAAELKAKLGTPGNAEDMIQLAAERYTKELRAASHRPVDDEATAEMDEDTVQGFVGDREVLAYAVRGPFLVVVSTDEDDFTIKQAFALDEKKAEKLMPRERAPEPEADDEDSETAEAKSSGGTAKATATATAKK